MSDWIQTAETLEAALSDPSALGRPEVFRRAYELLPRNDIGPPARELVRVYHALVQHLFIWGNSFCAEQLAGRAATLARRIEDPELLSKGLGIHAAMLAELDRHTEGVALYIESLRLAKELGNVHRQRSTWLNLGQSFGAIEAYEPARRCTEIALSLTRHDAVDEWELEARSFALGNLAEICFRQENYDDGLRYVDEAIACPVTEYGSNHVLHRVSIFATRARLHAAVGALDVASADLSCASAVGPLAGKRGAVEIDIVRGSFDLAKGNTAVALNRFRAAVERTYTDAPGLTNRALLELSKAMDHAGVDPLENHAALAFGARVSNTQNAILLRRSSQSELPEDPWSAQSTSQTVASHSQSVDPEKFAPRLIAEEGSEGNLKGVFELLDDLAYLSELKYSPGMHNHCLRVGGIAGEMAKEWGVDALLLDAVVRAASWHGIGYMAVPLFALSSSKKAWKDGAVRMASGYGSRMLDGIDAETARLAAIMCNFRLNRWDGSGAVDEPMGQAVPYVARLVAVADGFDMVLQQQTGGTDLSAAVSTLVQEDGGTFDPDMIGVLMQTVRRLNADEKLLARITGPEAPANRIRLPSELRAMLV